MRVSAGSEPTQASGADLLARTLKGCGIERVFALCGDHINALYRALDMAGIEILSVRQESAAVHMADGWARATGRPGVAVVTGGPGHTNAITGLAVAHNAGTPILVISGATALKQRQRGGLQALEQGEIARPVTKFMHEVLDADHFGEFLARSLQVAMAGTPGPVNIGAPLDKLIAPLKAAAEPRTPAYQTALAIAPHYEVGGEEDLRAAVEVLAAAERPLAVIGSGAFWEYSGSELRDLMRGLEVPVFTVDLARGLVPDDGECCFGYADALLSRTFREARDADVVLLVGARADCHLGLDGAGLLDERAKLIQLHRDAYQIGMNRGNVAAFVGPIRPILARFADAMRARPGNGARARWLTRVRNAYAAEAASWDASLARLKLQSPASGIHPLQLCRSLQRHRTDDTCIVVDAGDFIHWPRSYFPARRRGRWMDGGTYGALGAALPLGIGAQLAFPGDPVWIFLGDGGFGFYAWELATAAARGLPVKVIVGNDAAWGVEKRLQLGAYGHAVGCDLPDIRYDRFAELVGARGFRVERPDELDAVVDRFLGCGAPALLDVRIARLAGRPLAPGHA